MESPFLDIDAFVPRPVGTIVVGGRKHAVLHPSDLSYDEYLRLVAAAENPTDRSLWRRLLDWLYRITHPRVARAEELAEKHEVGRLLTEITSLVPTLSRRELLSLRMSEIGAILTWIRKEVGEEPEGKTTEPESN